MGVETEVGVGDEQRGNADDAHPFNIFLNYRRSDSAGQARALYDRLSERFGAENVFLDVASLDPGVVWLEEIRRRGTTCGAFLALIGSRWVEIMDERRRREVVESATDHVRLELEAALRPDSGVLVVPVLLDGARMPPRDRLPHALRVVTGREASLLRHARWDDDVAALIEMLERLSAAPTTLPAAPPRLTIPPPDPEPVAEPLARPPDRRHFQSVAGLFTEGASVLPFLGPGVNAGEEGEAWSDASDRPPDAAELAAHLSRRFDLPLETTDLPRVAQYVLLTRGEIDLYRTLRKALAAECPPTAVHKFLARAPSCLRQAGLDPAHVLVVTSNYDLALERALDDAAEPYDVAVYTARGEDRGKFVHVPYDGDPVVIAKPNTYTDFPIDDEGGLARTVIVKIHGAADRSRGQGQWRDNYVITEDDYISYLSQTKVSEVVPVQILEKMRQSHFLFLGYSMRDWNLRVFLQRLWGEQVHGGKCWAVQRTPDLLDVEFCRDLRVDLFASPLADYVRELDEHLAALARDGQPV